MGSRVRLAAFLGVAGAVLAAAACVGEAPSEGPGSSTSEGGAPDGPEKTDEGGSDGGGDVQAPRCDPTKPFRAPVKLAGVNTELSEASPFLTADGSTLLFVRKDADGGDDIWTATRAGDATFTDVRPLSPKINSAAADNDPFLSEDGTALYFARGYPASDLFVAKRPTRDSEFGDPAPLANVNQKVPTDPEDSHPFVTQDGNWLYFRSNRVANRFSIYRSRRGPDGAFGEPQLVPELNSEGSRNHRATLTGDQRTVYFTSDRAGAEWIFVATRSDPEGVFGDIHRVDELTVEANTLTGQISADGCVLVFAARTAASATPFDLWIAVKPP
jgi:Tol biopolymer transport system component